MCVSLHWVFLVCGLSLVVENRVYSLDMMYGLLIAMAFHVEHVLSWRDCSCGSAVLPLGASVRLPRQG